MSTPLHSTSDYVLTDATTRPSTWDLCVVRNDIAQHILSLVTKESNRYYNDLNVYETNWLEYKKSLIMLSIADSYSDVSIDTAGYRFNNRYYKTHKYFIGYNLPANTLTNWFAPLDEYNDIIKNVIVPLSESLMNEYKINLAI